MQVEVQNVLQMEADVFAVHGPNDMEGFLSYCPFTTGEKDVGTAEADTDALVQGRDAARLRKGIKLSGLPDEAKLGLTEEAMDALNAKEDAFVRAIGECERVQKEIGGLDVGGLKPKAPANKMGAKNAKSPDATFNKNADGSIALDEANIGLAYHRRYAASRTVADPQGCLALVKKLQAIHKLRKTLVEAAHKDVEQKTPGSHLKEALDKESKNKRAEAKLSTQEDDFLNTL